MKEINYPNQIRIEYTQKISPSIGPIDFTKLSAEEAQKCIIDNFVNETKLIDTTKKLPDGSEIHPNTDVFDTYIRPIQIKEEKKAEKEKLKYKAFLSTDSYNLVQKRLGREISLEEFKNNFFIFNVDTEILFGNQNTAKILGRIISYLDPSEYDRENPANTKKYVYVANFSEADKINEKDFTVCNFEGVKHPKNMRINTVFFANPDSAVRIENLSKQNRNHLQK